MNWQQLLGQSAWAATLILVAGFAGNRALRAAPAAWRHFLWTAVLASLLALPAAVRLAPQWTLGAPTPPVAASETMAVTQDVTFAIAPQKSAWNPLLLAWFIGFALAFLRFFAGRIRAAHLVRHATNAAFAREWLDGVGGHGVRVLQSSRTRTPLAAGIFRPVIIVPADAGTWPVERLRAALLHEWMHVQRRDLLAQAIAQAACSLYWFHPLAWLAARQLRREREQACDDAVLAGGIAPQEYAGHLVASARAMRGQRIAALAMAEPSELELRVKALLDCTRDRRPLSRVAAAAMIAALAMVLLPVAAITVHAQTPAPPPLVAAPQPVSPAPPVVAASPETQEPQAAPVAEAKAEPAPVAEPASTASGTISGVVVDPSGARVPNCAVQIMDGNGYRQSSISNQLGEFQFDSVPEGRYSLQVTANGFKRITRANLTVQANQPLMANLRMEVGSLTEAVTITGSRPAIAPMSLASPAAATAAGRVRVGGSVQAAMIVKKVAPEYPEELRAQGIAGTVHLAAIVGKDGSLTNIRVLDSPAPGLSAAAVAAASRWVYRPSLLNGEPVEVEAAIDVTFALQ